MLKKALSRFFCKEFYPTNSSDWYKRKGYKGEDDQEIFANFLSKQRTKDETFYNCFEGLELRRFKVQSGRNFLDCVELIPNEPHVRQKILELLSFKQKNNPPGINLVFVMFQGRGEYYESRFRDMALLCHATGARVIGFNPKGFHASTGRTKILKDIVDDGQSVLKYLLAHDIDPTKIVLLGNSLGGGVQEMVCQRLKREGVDGFRQINSNSFRSLGAVVARRLKISFLENQVSAILRYSGWEVDVPDSFYEVGVQRIHLRRYLDRTIDEEAEYHSRTDIESSIANITIEAKDDLAWVIRHNQLMLGNDSDNDPHNLSLYRFIVKPINDKDELNHEEMTVFELINKYLAISNKDKKS